MGRQTVDGNELGPKHSAAGSCAIAKATADNMLDLYIGMALFFTSPSKLLIPADITILPD